MAIPTGLTCDHTLNNINVTRSKEMSHMLLMFNLDFQYKLLVHLKCYILFQIPSQSDIWLQRYEPFLEFAKQCKT